jgi:TolB-like protein/DNA-binding winged helix-turn-helix (wHTH) protein/Tfp pilus assembly protein PilF
MASPAVSYKFGPFELRARTCELYREGIRLKLRPQGVRVLLLLVERAGDLVTRTELHESLWSDKDFGDFEQGLNNTIWELRGVMNDSASDPVYIGTLPKMGYRMIAPVETCYAPAPGETLPQLSGASEPPIPEPPQAFPKELPTRKQTLWPVALGLVVVCALLVGMVWHWMYARAQVTRGSEQVMVAVLPFANLTGDANQEYFSDGMTEELISQLGRHASRNFGVISRTSVMHYKNAHLGIDEIGNELRVQYALEGTVRRDGNNLRVSAQLVDLRGRTLWSRAYDRNAENLLTIQGEIADEISLEILDTVGAKGAAIDAAKKFPPARVNSEAYDLYLRGTYALNKRTLPGLTSAVSYFEQAIAKDDSYAPAYAGLSNCYALLNGYSEMPREDFSSKAKSSAERALELDPNLAEAHAALALIEQNHDWQWEAAAKEFQQAIALNPNYATAHHWYAEHLGYRGKFDEAFREFELARRLDPLSLIIASDRGMLLYYARRYDESIKQFGAVRAMEPNFLRANMGMFPGVQSHAKEVSLDYLAEAYRLYGKNAWYWANAAYVYGQLGDRKKAREALRKLQQLNQQQQRDPGMFVVAYLGLGDSEQALHWLAKSLENHSNVLTTLKVDAIYDPLRNDPRFLSILQSIRLDK